MQRPEYCDATSDAIHAAIGSICEGMTLEAVMRATREAARRFTGADGVTFVLRAGDSCYYADEEAIAPLWKGQRFPLHHCISGWVMRHRQSVLIPDIYKDDRIPHGAYRPTFVHSLIMVPIRREDPIAALGAYWKQTGAPTAEHVRVVELLAEAASTQLSSGQLWAKLRETIA